MFPCPLFPLNHFSLCETPGPPGKITRIQITELTNCYPRLRTVSSAWHKPSLIFSTRLGRASSNCDSEQWNFSPPIFYARSIHIIGLVSADIWTVWSSLIRMTTKVSYQLTVMMNIQHQYRNSLTKSKLSNYGNLNAALRLEIIKWSSFCSILCLKVYPDRWKN